ncbi:MAG: hypothetical protein ACJ8LI_03445 [Chthoniobacterales bacterium]
MLAQVRKFRRVASLLLLTSAAVSLGACATHQEAPLISDGANGRESALPWNKQEKWEGTGQAGALADQLQTR